MIRMYITPKTSYLADLQHRLAVMGAQSLPATRHAFTEGVKVIADTWRAVASGKPLNGIKYIKHSSGGYASGVKVKQSGAFDYTVYNDSEIASVIEHGAPELDMKQTHPYGPKGRISNKGTRTNPKWVPYLIVPFRWGTPGSGGHFRNIIPEEIYSMIRMQIKEGIFIRTMVTENTHDEPNYWGESVQRNEYQGENGRPDWGSMFRGVGGHIEGLSAMVADTTKKKDTNYFTFRVISADSPARSWIRPERPALNITKHVADATRDIISEMIEHGIRTDLGL